MFCKPFIESHRHGEWGRNVRALDGLFEGEEAVLYLMGVQIAA